MIQIVNAIFLGVVQGVTEFIPVSSSGHLIVARELFSITVSNPLAFDIFLHIATLGAVVVYFRKDLADLFVTVWRWVRGGAVADRNTSLVIALGVATVPAALVGFVWGDWIEAVLRTTPVVIVALVGGSLIFWWAEKRGQQEKELSVRRGFMVGLFQVLAFFPGMSRSGITISGGLFVGLSREAAARFSFLLSIPILFGSGLFTALDIGQAGLLNLGTDTIVGSVVAFGVGLVAIHWLLRFLRSRSLMVFVWYRLVLAGFLLLTFVV